MTGALLLAVLGVINLLPYAKRPALAFLNQPSDWTESRIHSLAPASRATLESVDRPLKIYVVIPLSATVLRQGNTLMENIHGVSSKMDGNQQSPHRNLKQLAG